MAEAADVDVVDIAEEAKSYKDEWLLFEVTEVDEIDRPVKGRLLYHCKTRLELHGEVMKAWDKDTYTFFTGPPVPPDMVMVPMWISIPMDQMDKMEQ